jgi:hypothetical protein
MTFSTEGLITYGLVFLAALFLGSRFYRAFYARRRGGAAGCGNCGCKGTSDAAEELRNRRAG